MDFYEIFVRSPINRSARNMLSASAECEKEISTDELKYLISRLHRKRKLLNLAIGIKTKAQRKNLALKLNQGVRTYRDALNPRGVDEWSRNGKAIERLCDELGARKPS